MRRIRILIVTSYKDRTIETVLGEVDYVVLQLDNLDVVDLTIEQFKPDLIITQFGLSSNYRKFMTSFAERGLRALHIVQTYFHTQYHGRYYAKYKDLIAFSTMPHTDEMLIEAVEAMISDIQDDVDWLNQIYQDE
ncbi:MAG: hypothetical protein AAF846_17495 [Chloroflexota bacterium]